MGTQSNHKQVFEIIQRARINWNKISGTSIRFTKYTQFAANKFNRSYINTVVSIDFY